MARFIITAMAIAMVFVTSVTAAQKAYLRLVYQNSNIFNETTSVGGDSGFVPILDYSFEMHTSTIGSTTSGAGAGKVVPMPLQFVKAVDRNSANFFAFQFQELVFDYAIIKVVNGNNNVVSKFTFGNVLISDYVINGTANGGAAEETVTTTFDKFSWQVSSAENDGSASPAQTGSWDLVKNVPN